jgi:glutamine phosphoribosylpyrophosphate amidotransferase
VGPTAGAHPARRRAKERATVCGIIGYLERRPHPGAPVGRLAQEMLSALGRRGPDSAGVALYDKVAGDTLRVRVALPAGAGCVRPGDDPGADLSLVRPPAEAARAALAAAVAAHAPLLDASVSGPEIELWVGESADVSGLERAIEAAVPGAEVLCAGRRLRLLKQVGLAADLEATYHLSTLSGSHLIGHTRMATESRVDLSHSQPFWAHGTLDLAVVHNGHITNYHQLRRRYEQRGHRFYTENDSEIIGLYLADQMRRDGVSLETAMQRSLDDLDGSFSYVVGSAEGIGYAKDRFGLKPLLLVEEADFVALATEEIALHAALGPVAARELPTASTRFWEKGRLLALSS